MAAGEDELKPLIGDLILVHLVHLRLRGRRRGGLDEPQLGGEHAVTAQPVDRPVPRRRHQPRDRAVGHPLGRPAPGRDRERLRRRFLGKLEVAEVPDEQGEHPGPRVTEYLLKWGQNGFPSTGRISTVPPSRSTGIRAAISVAWSRLSHSYR